MFSCRLVTRLISDGLDRSLSAFERLCLGVHVLGCGPCRRFRRAVRWLHDALPYAPDKLKRPSAIRQRIRRALEQAAQEE
jgi:hypothetical protein